VLYHVCPLTFFFLPIKSSDLAQRRSFQLISQAFKPDSHRPALPRYLDTWLLCEQYVNALRDIKSAVQDARRRSTTDNFLVSCMLFLSQTPSMFDDLLRKKKTANGCKIETEILRRCVSTKETSFVCSTFR